MKRSDWIISAVGVVVVIALGLVMDLAGVPRRTWLIAAAVAVSSGVSTLVIRWRRARPR